MGAAPNCEQHPEQGPRAPAARPTGAWQWLLSTCIGTTRQPVFFLVAAFLVGSFSFTRYVVSPLQTGVYQIDRPQTTDFIGKATTPLYSVASLEFSKMPNQVAVEKAVRFILHLQPEGSYILTSENSDDIVHMDVAHSAIALSKVGHVKEAKKAMDWLLAHMTTPNSPDRRRTVTIDKTSRSVDYAGSWYDHFRRNGEPRRDLTRGRGEGVGMALIAVYAVYQEDPAYLRHSIDGTMVIDDVAMAVHYLTSDVVQRDDGRFNHRPDYQVSFNEEGTRMVLGLRLASDMLRATARVEDADLAAEHAAKGLAALQNGNDINQGMAFDYYALSIWGLATPEQAREEFVSLKDAHLVSPDGVRNWDWQLNTAKSLWSRLRWWATSQSIAPAQTFDWAIANVTIGNIEEARRVEQRWLPLQRADGGFSGVYLPGLRVGLGDPTSYTAARFILLERLLANASALERSVVTQ
ncbi:MAG: hypothetical protein M1358_24825 [Chloroflexi bacterium]|nr:hypothetical protein [Chloroflexota bacterium]